MATLLDKSVTVEREAQLHNAQINERYRRLQNALADQFAESTQEVRDESAYAVRASVLTPEAPAVESTPVTEQTPQVTEFVRERVDAPVFTTEKFDFTTQAPTPVATQAPVELQYPMQAPVQNTSVAKQVEYSLSRMAKVVMATFVALVVVMLTFICLNTHKLEFKRIKVKNLEEKRQELIERNEELQRRIEQAQSEDVIREYALSQGMIRG